MAAKAVLPDVKLLRRARNAAQHDGLEPDGDQVPVWASAIPPRSRRMYFCGSSELPEAIRSPSIHTIGNGRDWAMTPSRVACDNSATWTSSTNGQPYSRIATAVGGRTVGRTSSTTIGSH